jgi:cell division protein FtsL
LLEAVRNPVLNEAALETRGRKKRITRRKTDRRTNKTNSPNNKLRVLGVIVTIFVFGVYYTSLSASIASKSYQLEKLQREIAQLETSNERLELTLNSMSSLDKVETIAVEKLGLEKRTADGTALVASVKAVDTANAAEGDQSSEEKSGQEETTLAFGDFLKAFIGFFSPGNAQASNN